VFVTPCTNTKRGQRRSQKKARVIKYASIHNNTVNRTILASVRWLISLPGGKIDGNCLNYTQCRSVISSRSESFAKGSRLRRSFYKRRGKSHPKPNLVNALGMCVTRDLVQVHVCKFLVKVLSSIAPALFTTRN